jgi:hypothetical protein
MEASGFGKQYVEVAANWRNIDIRSMTSSQSVKLFPTVDFRIAVIREQATDAQLKYVDDH